MFQGKIEGIRLLKEGNASVVISCNGDDLQAIANSRQGTLTCYGDGEAPTTDDRVTVLDDIRRLAEQMARALDRELKGVEND